MILRSMALALTALLLTACGDNMAKQAKQNPYEETASVAPHLPPPGTVARSDPVQNTRPDVNRRLLDRGHERYRIFCMPCHGKRGKGDGPIVEAGFPRPPSYHSEEIRSASAQHIFTVISKGTGLMYSYASRVPRRDRWAIIAYIRALQLAELSNEVKK